MVDCIFCDIVSKRIPAKKIYEDEKVMAFLDINPRNPGHTLVIPKKHIESIMDADDSDIGYLFQIVKRVATAVMSGIDADGISISQSNGKAAGQVIPHIHFHIIPRFETEGPVGLEDYLPIKKLDKESMNKIANNIKNNLSKIRESSSEKEKEKEDKPSTKEKRIETDEFEELDFDI